MLNLNIKYLIFFSCGERVNKWNSEVSKLCDFCHEIENVAHMLYQCNRVKHIWRLIGEQLKITVKLKHIILGALNKTHTSEVRNLIVVIVAYSIYSSWNKCKFEKYNYKEINLKMKIKSNLLFYNAVFSFVLDTKTYNLFQSKVENIIQVL